MPEEINRRAADICSSMYFIPTEKSAINLLAEGFSHKNLFITGKTEKTISGHESSRFENEGK